MGIRFYDEALLGKFSKWTKDTQVHIMGVNDTKRMFSLIADKGNDNPIKLPLIAISRPGGYKVISKSKQPRSYMGFSADGNSKSTAQLNAIPVEIDYQIDIYTRYLEEADEYARNIVFNIINYPKLSIEIPYENMELTHVANIRMVSEVEDNSDVPERLVPGQFTRLTIGINIDDAYLFDVRIRDNLSIAYVELSQKSSHTEGVKIT